MIRMLGADLGRAGILASVVAPATTKTSALSGNNRGGRNKSSDDVGNGQCFNPTGIHSSFKRES
jgi:hypothetical protein